MLTAPYLGLALGRHLGTLILVQGTVQPDAIAGLQVTE
jgi:hypothetical protein